MERLKTFGQYAIALGLAYMATAILLLAFEVSAVRREIPQLIAGLEGEESNPFLARIDAALEELPRATEEIAAIRAEIPQVLEESAAIRALVPEILAEVKEVRAAIAPLLEESAALRNELPGIIRGAKGVSKNVGKGAAQGAVEGTVKGIVGAPFEVLKQGADILTPDGGDSDEADKDD